MKTANEYKYKELKYLFLHEDYMYLNIMQKIEAKAFYIKYSI